KNLFNVVRCLYQVSSDRVIQYPPFAIEWNLFQTPVHIGYEHCFLIRSGQDLYRIRFGTEEDLFGQRLLLSASDIRADPFGSDGDVMSPGRTDVDRSFVSRIVWIFRDHHATVVHDDSGLNEDAHVSIVMIDEVSLARLVCL